MRAGASILAAALAAAGALLSPGSAAASPTPFQAGAAAVDITPPAFNAAQDRIDLPEVDLTTGTICPRAVFNGTRRWRFEEPYIDQAGTGHFQYPDPFCDYNHNGRWDGIYSSGGIDVPLTSVHDQIDTRAIAISDGSHAVVIVSVVAQGLHDNYIDPARTMAQQMRPGISDVVISANHNESSPDTVGIYGAPPVTSPITGTLTGGTSGIDDYYYSFLDGKIAEASVRAFDAMKPASLRETELQVPGNLQQEVSQNFPTNDKGAAAAIDPKIRVLQARDAISGGPIFTMANLAAHNQEIGHGIHTDTISADWPGYFQRKLDADLGGTGMFLVGDNGSEEDLKTNPRVSCPSSDPGPGCFLQAQRTGETLANAVEASLASAKPLAFGPVSSQRDEFFVPLENNVFRAAAAAGLFGQRQLYTGGVPTGRVGPDLKTSVSVVRVGPDLQFLANPGEAFPGLMLGSPWGIDDPNGLHENVGCPNRPNPSVPSWHASASHRFQIGLANDMIGYEIPAWANTDLPGVFANQPPNLDTCFNDPNTGLDPAGHRHKLETEGVGPSASNATADHLTALLDQTPDPVAQIRRGRFVMADGTLSRRAVSNHAQDPRCPTTCPAVAVWLAAPGSTTLTAGTGTIVSIGDVGSFGTRPVDALGTFMDYDGAAQAAPDISTRGMLVPAGGGSAANRYYVNVYPALAAVTLGHSNPPVPPGGGGGGSGGAGGGTAGQGSAGAATSGGKLGLRVRPKRRHAGRRECFKAYVSVSGAPVSGATVRLGSRSKLTRANGRVRICRSFSHPRKAVVHASKAGFGPAQRRVKIV